MSANERIEVPRTLRGNLARIGGLLGGIVLAWGMQPFAAHAHAKADEHFALYSQYLDEAGITAGINIDVQPGDQTLLDKAHGEEDAGSNWQYVRLAEEGGAATWLVAGVVAGLIAARREETTAATLPTVTQIVPTGK